MSRKEPCQCPTTRAAPASLLLLYITSTYTLLAAPEILSEAQAFPQSDIWSLGVLLYVLLSGQLPFRGDSAEETRDNILGVRFKFEWLYKEVTMEATRQEKRRPLCSLCVCVPISFFVSITLSRLLMWIFKRGPW